MRAGGVGLCMATLIARTPVGVTAIHGGLLDYPTPAAAGAVATGQLAWYRALEEAGEVALLATGDELRAHAGRWRAGEERRVGIVLAMEGSDPIISPEHVARWHATGLRVASLVHYGLGRYAGGTGTDGELTAAGRALLDAFADVGLILDLTPPLRPGVLPGPRPLFRARVGEPSELPRPWSPAGASLPTSNCAWCCSAAASSPWPATPGCSTPAGCAARPATSWCR